MKKVISILVILTLIMGGIYFFRQKNINELEKSGFEKMGGGAYLYFKEGEDKNTFISESIISHFFPNTFTLSINNEKDYKNGLAGIWIERKNPFKKELEYGILQNPYGVCLTNEDFTELKEDNDVRCFENENLLANVKEMKKDLKKEFIKVPYIKDLK